MSDNFSLDTVTTSVMLGVQGDSKRIHTFYVAQAFIATAYELKLFKCINQKYK